MSDLKRFVLFNAAKNLHGEVERLSEVIPGVRLIESVGNKGFLVEAPANASGELKRLLPGWAIEEERIYPLPTDHNERSS